jgi:glyoxylase-like metal-dependent hydrolase (beta-lactamase superfamily II)
MTIPPGIHRLGDRHVNFYLVEDGRDLTLIDAGLPGHWSQLVDALAALGRSVRDIVAVLVTHGHLDHIGLAERVRAAAGAQIWVHEHDAPILRAPLRTRQIWRPERSLLPYVAKRPSGLQAPLHLARLGALRTPAVPDLQLVPDGQALDIPGNPTAIHTPGHTAGSVTYLLAGPAVAFTGDALVTLDEITGHTGPTLLCRAFTQNSQQALASLTTLATLPADTVLPGHGNPWPHGLTTAAHTATNAGIR